MTSCVTVMTKCDNNSIAFSLLRDNHRNVRISLSPTTEYLSDARIGLCARDYARVMVGMVLT